jgi:hypothetical protein
MKKMIERIDTGSLADFKRLERSLMAPEAVISIPKVQRVFLEEHGFLGEGGRSLGAYMQRSDSTIPTTMRSAIGYTLSGFVIDGMMSKDRAIRAHNETRGDRTRVMMLEGIAVTPDTVDSSTLIAELNLNGALAAKLLKARSSVPTLYTLSDNELRGAVGLNTKEISYLKSRLYAYLRQLAQFTGNNTQYIDAVLSESREEGPIRTEAKPTEPVEFFYQRV